jgi:phosphate-selective porin OprO/OprP
MLEEEKWGVRTDLSAAAGYETASDVWGATLLPFYNISKHFQVVTRYTFLRSIDPNGLRLARYENQVVNGRGDEYQEIYFGLNWYLYGHKLKLQTGVDYAHMADRANDGGAYNGWGWTTGLRISW